MKIIWIVNTLLPQIARDCGLTPDNDGGWLSASLENLLNNKDYNVTVCFPGFDGTLSGKTGNLTYYSFAEPNSCKYSRSLETFFQNVIEKENPDVIHIFGTEFPHTLAAVNACRKNGLIDNCIISIQGLISECAKEYYAGLPATAIYGFSLRDFLKMDNVYFQKKVFEKRGKYEIKALETAKNVMGRTEWDRTHTKAINENLNYFHCNESLRSSFYEKIWDYKTCEKHSIFVSQGYYPLKGLHHALKAVSEILKKYPDAHMYTTNEDDKSKSFISRIKHQTYYQLYLKKLIRKYGLKDKITFLGGLNEIQMCERYLKSNVFLLCSSIENSSNSLCEAMILGVPSVASDVGGVKSLIENNTEGLLYPFNKPDMIAVYIDKIFSDTNLANQLSENARAHALITHSRENNHKRLEEIYSIIAAKKEK